LFLEAYPTKKRQFRQAKEAKLWANELALEVAKALLGTVIVPKITEIRKSLADVSLQLTPARQAIKAEDPLKGLSN
jgi:hypothetical protein